MIIVIASISMIGHAFICPSALGHPGYKIILPPSWEAEPGDNGSFRSNDDILSVSRKATPKTLYRNSLAKLQPPPTFRRQGGLNWAITMSSLEATSKRPQLNILQASTYTSNTVLTLSATLRGSLTEEARDQLTAMIVSVKPLQPIRLGSLSSKPFGLSLNRMVKIEDQGESAFPPYSFGVVKLNSSLTSEDRKEMVEAGKATLTITQRVLEFGGASSYSQALPSTDLARISELGSHGVEMWYEALPRLELVDGYMCRVILGSAIRTDGTILATSLTWVPNRKDRAARMPFIQRFLFTNVADGSRRLRVAEKVFKYR